VGEKSSVEGGVFLFFVFLVFFIDTGFRAKKCIHVPR